MFTRVRSRARARRVELLDTPGLDDVLLFHWVMLQNVYRALLDNGTVLHSQQGSIRLRLFGNGIPIAWPHVGAYHAGICLAVRMLPAHPGQCAQLC